MEIQIQDPNLNPKFKIQIRAKIQFHNISYILNLIEVL